MQMIDHPVCSICGEQRTKFVDTMRTLNAVRLKEGCDCGFWRFYEWEVVDKGTPDRCHRLLERKDFSYERCDARAADGHQNCPEHLTNAWPPAKEERL